MPVNKVVYELGFSEANHFSAFFKTYSGLTPTGYLSGLFN